MSVTRANCLARDFYHRPPAIVAKDLLGKVVYRQTAEGLCSGRIVETEAYEGHTDPAAHTYRGPTPRNAAMFGPPGHAYVYAIHSRWCMNTVTESEGIGTGVLIRAIEPLGGLHLMMQRRSLSLLVRRAKLTSRDSTGRLLAFDHTAEELIFKPTDLCRGPARLCEALSVNRELDGWDLTLGEQLWVEHDPDYRLALRQIARSPRIGISSAQDRLLRFFVRDNRFVSGKRTTT